MGTGNTYFASESLKVKVVIQFPSPTLDSWTHKSGYWRNRTKYTRCWFRVYIYREPCLSTARCCHIAGTVSNSSKPLSTLLSQLLQDAGEHGKISEFCENRHIAAFFFIFCDVSSLSWSNVVWSTMTMDKAFFKSKDNSNSRSIAHKKGRSISKVSIYSSKDKTLPSHDGRGPMWSTCHRLASWSTWRMVRYQGLNVGLCCWKIRHSVVVIVRSALLGRILYC